MTPRAMLSSASWLILAAAPAAGQLDPLLFLKGTRPNVVIALDVSSRMQRDARGAYLDPVLFERTGEAFEASLGVGPGVERRYRRRYVGLEWRGLADPVRATAAAIEIVGDLDAAFAGFDGSTRLARAGAAVRRVVETNGLSARFGLVTTRQAAARVDTATWQTISVQVPPPEQPTDTGVASRWRAGIPVTDGSGSGLAAVPRLIAADSATANADVCRLLATPGIAPPALLPAGQDDGSAVDAPLGLLLDDVRAEASRLVVADRSCANTVVILIAGGGDPALGLSGLGDRARALQDVSGRRVRLHVVAIAPAAWEAAQLRYAAEQGGGEYVEVTPADVDRPPAGEPVPEIVRALNFAVQHAFAAFADFNAVSPDGQPSRPRSYFPTASPVVGTVNLEGAVSADGTLLPDTRVLGPGGAVIPQAANVLFAAGFELPGFAGRLDAFRVYRPVVDRSRTTGYRFSSDGTRLWTARAPAPDVRNIFTVLPHGGLIPFRPENVGVLASYLGSRAADVIALVRSLPFGAIVNSTPALLDPPSMPFVDVDYAAFALEHARRRAIVFVGADDGMMHAVDARTGFEVWAVIPFNLLPKLRLLLDGGSLDAFPFLVDGSPRLADVKVAGAWRSYLLFGEGPGGTFYQAFDVTLDDMADSVPPDADRVGPLLAWFSGAGRIPFAWSFPSYAHFDPALPPWGDVSAAASDLEKSVGESWSTPAIARAGRLASRFVAIVGSGPLPASRERQPNRGGTRAGSTLYLLDMASGLPLDARAVDADGEGEDQDACPADGCLRLKNALQADPVMAADEMGSATRVYAGDLDGRVWRFHVISDADPPRFAPMPSLLFAAGADQPIFDRVALLGGVGGLRYLFLATGSDLLPRAGGLPPLRLIGLAESAGTVERRFERLLRIGGADPSREAAAGGASVAGGVAFFVTTVVGGSRCAPAETEVYALTVKGGAAYDSNGDGRRDDRDSPVVARFRTGRATAPVVADRHLFVAAGSRVEVLGDPDMFNASAAFLGLRILSWREVR